MIFHSVTAKQSSLLGVRDFEESAIQYSLSDAIHLPCLQLQLQVHHFSVRAERITLWSELAYRKKTIHIYLFIKIDVSLFCTAASHRNRLTVFFNFGPITV